jgi:hypothetical protein
VLPHLILLVGGIVLFFFPLYYQFYKVPPTRTRPERLQDMERVYVEDETVAPEAPPAFLPEA